MEKTRTKIFLSTLFLLMAAAVFLFLQDEAAGKLTGATDLPAFEIPEAGSPGDFPGNTCPIDRYGAIGDGTTMNTEAIASAIDDCASRGGGTVRIPEGRWLTGPIHLRSDIRIELDEGSEILFSQSFADYLPTVFSRYEGMELYNYSPLIYASDCTNIAITGKGVLDGQGSAWWSWKSRQQAGAERLYRMTEDGTPVEQRVFGTEMDALRPSFMQFMNCSGILLDGFTARNGPMWTIHPVYSSDILMRNLSIRTEGVNNDGIVIDSSERVYVENVSLDTEDDAIVIKSGLDTDGRRVGKPSQDISIRNCHVGRGNGGIVIGSEMSGDVRNISVSDCTFDGTKRGIRIKSMKGRGGTVENIRIENISMKNIEKEAILFDMRYESKNVITPTTDALPTFRNISIKNIECDQAGNAIRILGLPESPVLNTVFDTVDIRAKNGATVENVSGMTFKNVTIETEDPTNFHFEKAENILFEERNARKAYENIDDEDFLFR